MTDNRFSKEILFEDLSDIYDEIEKENGAEPSEEEVPVSAVPESAGETVSGEKTPDVEKEAVSGETVPDVEKETISGESAPEDDKETVSGENTPDGDKEMTPQKEKKPRKPFPWKKVLTAAAGVAAAGMIGAYGYGVYYYSSHFLPGTRAEDVVIENLTASEASELLTKSKLSDDRKFTLVDMDGNSVVFDTEPLSIERHYKGIDEALSAQDKWTFLFKKNQPKELDFDYDITYDRSGIEKLLSSLDICDPEKTVAPIDSYVYKDEETGKFLVASPVDGNTVDTGILSDAVAKAIDGFGKETDIASAGAYIKAAVREDDELLLYNADIENEIENIDISVVIDENIVEKMTPDQFRKMTAEHPENCTLDNIVDRDELKKFVDRIARMYTTKSASGYRYFKSFTGERKAMQTDYGWDMDEDAVAAKLLPVVAEVAYSIYVDEIVHYTVPSHSVEAVWAQTAKSHGERDTGDSWVEVDLTNQHVYCVIDGELKVETDCVTGLDRSAGRRTPTGFYEVNYKTTERDLVGYNPDGTESYRSHVHYWMPFNKNIGLHDATWRGRFGGTIYKNDGSHGCVNLPLAKAKELYGHVYKGLPVIVYK